MSGDARLLGLMMFFKEAAVNLLASWGDTNIPLLPLDSNIPLIPLGTRNVSDVANSSSDIGCVFCPIMYYILYMIDQEKLQVHQTPRVIRVF